MRGCHPARNEATLRNTAQIRNTALIRNTAQIRNGLSKKAESGAVPVRADGIRIGVVGVGYWGSRHIRVLRSATGVAAGVRIDSRLGGHGGRGAQRIDA